MFECTLLILCANMFSRRNSCSLTVRHLWKAVQVIHYQRQLANFERIYRYMKRLHGISAREVKVQLDHCVQDGLLILVKSVGVKGCKNGVAQEGYVLPKSFKGERHDWYCFECHVGGDVLCCSTCHRVYHISCVSTCSKIDSDFVCSVCNNSSDNCETLTVGRLNHLLKYVLKNLKKRLPASTTLWQNVSEPLLIEFLIHTQMNVDILNEKILDSKYKHIEQFSADVMTILHNIVIFEGQQSPLTVTVKETIDACVHDIKELKLCADCYQISHEKSDELWFCKPCKPPHELVYAQVKGYPFWPAKVIEKLNNQCDVRFFGGYHQRAMIDCDHIKPVTVNIYKLQKVPKSASWRKAWKELELHQILLQDAISQNLNVLSGSKELTEMVMKSKRKMKKRVWNNKKRQTNNTSKDAISSYLFQNYLSTENQNNTDFEIKRHNLHFRRKRKGRGRWRTRHTEHLVNNIEDTKSNTSSVNFPAHLSVATQTRCSSHHNLHKHVFELPANTIKREKKDYNELVSHIINGQKYKKCCENNYPYTHAFCNKYCPLNKYRKNIYSDIEVEMEIAEAKSIVTKIVNDSYNEIVDNLAISHLKSLEEMKRKIWCVICYQEANIHCCWNVDYCSKKCQSEHWEKGHSQMHSLMRGEDDLESDMSNI